MGSPITSKAAIPHGTLADSFLDSCSCLRVNTDALPLSRPPPPQTQETRPVPEMRLRSTGVEGSVSGVWGRVWFDGRDTNLIPVAGRKPKFRMRINLIIVGCVKEEQQHGKCTRSRRTKLEIPAARCRAFGVLGWPMARADPSDHLHCQSLQYECPHL